MFEPVGLGKTIFQERYTSYPTEDWDHASFRVAEHVARAEQNGNFRKWTDRFYSEIVENRFMPGGRTWYGAGRPKAQLLNCFVLPTADSREGWGKTISDVIVVSGTGGGIGINCSSVRPRGAEIKGTGGRATGPVSLMQLINKVGDVIVGGGTRRTALMLCLDINHPDIQEFLDSKLKLDQLNLANISVVLNQNTQEFQRLVREGGKFDLFFAGRPTGGQVQADIFWQNLVENAWKNGEPGVLNGFEANRQSNIFYYKPLISTNPCLTGDSRIMTVDGPRTFASLAEDGKDVLVYAWHPDTKKPVIRWMRSPRLTRRQAEIIEVEFDSGLKLRCTPDHSLYTFRGRKIKARDLTVGQSVRAWSMSEHRDGHLRVHGWDSSRNCADHQWVARMVYENAYGEIPVGMIVHHKDGNEKHNALANLELVESNSEHNRIHYPDRLAAGFEHRKNHKVIAIRAAGAEDVYNGTVDDAHSYIVLDPEPVAGVASGIVSANCGEIWLEEYGCCCLGALVLPRFVKNGQMDWDQLDYTIRTAVRFLDNVLTVNVYPLPEIKENSENVRRIGMGVMGLHSMLLELGYRYSSPEGKAFVGELFDFIKQVAYDTSIHLAVEKGPFPAFDQRFLESGFSKTLKRGMRAKIREYGIRNCALLTIAPTGTTSIVAGVSSGVEPLFAPVYWRNYRKIDEQAREHKARELVVTPEFQKFGELAEGAYDIPVRDHFEIQAIVQKHIDNAVSKTINLPKDFSREELADTWLDFLPDIKGSTFYREGSRGNEPLEYIPVQDARRVLEENSFVLEFNAEEQSSLDCPNGVCELPRASTSGMLVEESQADREMAGVGSAG